jgi:2-polyprenyl-3-methyl-5-hydroxy-6-metoxy-1,4-benzoquinol methylase
MNCQNCGNIANNFLNFFNLGKLPIANNLLSKKNEVAKKYLLKIIICKKCKLIQTSNKIKKRIIFNCNYPYLSSVSKNIVKKSKIFFNEIKKKYKINKKHFILEVGSNDGYLLNNFRKENIPCLGIEPSKIPADISKKKKIPTINNFFSKHLAIKMLKIHSKFNFIIANNVIAHVPNIHDIFDGFKIILNQNGIIIIEFQYVFDLIRNKILDNIYHEHYLYLSINSLANILNKHDFEIFDIFRLNNHGGSLRVYLKRTNNINYKKTKRYFEILKYEKKNEKKNLFFYKNFKKKIIINKIKYLRLIKTLIKNKKKLIGYGAAAKATIFLNYLNIEKDVVPYIIDNAKSKQNKFIPGVNIPIISQSEVDLKKYDYIIIFAWNLRNEIKNFINKSYPKNNFRYITFFPRLSISK